MPSEFEDIERKWSGKWREARVYERDPEPGREKFFATYPYSYMNGFPHLGHGFTMIRNDVFTRYQRMRGKNALFPMGFHVTGTPIVAAANRVREGEPKQIAILKDMGIPAEEVPKFADPTHWVRYFPKEWRQDIDRLGLGIDWRREFFTTDLNPHYDAFIRWQFRQLREKGFVEKGKHPIMWCPKDQAPVADHDRSEGEGETPQEWTLYKMPLAEGVAGLPKPTFLIAATLRPDTVFGQTNVWVDPHAQYRALEVGGDTWLVNQSAADVLPLQIEGARLRPETVFGHQLLGLHVTAVGTGARVPVLPATFIKEGKGTGIVTSVPSDSPQDLLSLKALQAGTYDLAPLQSVVPADRLDALVREAKAITPIPVIKTQKYGTESAAKAVAEVGATSHADAAKIASATDLAYNAGFYEGVMLENAGEFAGKPTAEVKEGIRRWLEGRGEAATGYWPSGPVRCRCLTPCVVKIVSDQWFMKYSDPEWKQRTHEAMDRMSFMPELARKQFHIVVDWLREWACAREHGLGTRLPWDERWLIESLSDSTIYMAYYHLAPWLERGTVTGAGANGKRKGPGVDAADLTDAFFDYVLLGKGTPEGAAKGTVTVDVVRACRAEFEYWYPVDFRNSGKDLLQNHLTFFVFNHVAIWDDPKYWPKAIGVNGWLLLNGEKMSKSSGNFMTLREGLERFGPTGARLGLINAGEGVDDANFEEDFVFNVTKRVRAWLEFAKAPPATGPGIAQVDAWFRSVLYRTAEEAGKDMENGDFRTAFKKVFFDLQREWSWYVRRSGGAPSASILREFLDVQNRLLTPFAPHVAEEVHEALGKPGFAIDAPWPTAPEGAISPQAEAGEAFVKRVLDDTREILKVTGIEPKRVIFYTSPAWKRAMQSVALQLAMEGNLKVPTLMSAAMQDPEIKKNGKDAPKLAQDLVKELGSLKPDEARARAGGIEETAVLQAAAPFFSGEFGGAEVSAFAAGAPGVEDPANKARFAAPGRPAIYVA